MNDWKRVKGKRRNIEIAALIVSVVLFVVGMIIEIKGIHCIELKMEFMLTLLQIQATVMTIVFTVLAFLSGLISDSYMGVPVGAFYLKTYPSIFKQHVTIILGFSCLGIGIGLYLANLFVLCVSVFVISLVFIGISCWEAYAVFDGRSKCVNLIECFVVDSFKRGSNYSERGSLFIGDWKRVAKNQTSEEFEQYFSLFMTCVERGLKDFGDVSNANNLSESMASFLLRHDNEGCRIKGIHFVYSFYERIMAWIHNNRNDAERLQSKIHLIDRILRDWLWAVDSLDPEIVERQYSWDLFSENVVRVACWLDWKEGETCSEVKAILNLAQSLGLYWKRQRDKGYKINADRWEMMISDRFRFVAYDVPDKAKDYCVESLALRDYLVCAGLIKYGEINIVRKGVFISEISHIYKVDCPAEILKILLIHCYLYYLAFRENGAPIEETLRAKILTMVTDKKTVDAISSVIWSLIQSKNMLSQQTEEKMEEYIEKCRIWENEKDDQWINISVVVRDYFLYVAILINRYSYQGNALSDLLELEKYVTYLKETKHEQIIERLCKINILFHSGLNDVENRREVEEKFYVFYSAFSKKYKKHILETAQNAQEEFEEIRDNNEWKEGIIKSIEDTFTDNFSALNSEHFKGKKTRKATIKQVFTTATVYASDKKMGHTCAQHVLQELCRGLIRELKQNWDTREISRKEAFHSDKEFRAFLKDNKYDILMGSEYVFGRTNFEEYTDHADFLNDRMCLFGLPMDCGIATRSGDLLFELNEVDVKIVSPLSDVDVDSKTDERNGMISYRTIEDIKVDFEKEEYIKYLNDTKKKVEITLNVTIGVTKRKKFGICTIVTRE